VSATEIDEGGLALALRLATRRAVEQVQQSRVAFDEIVIDGTINFLSNTRLEQFTTTIKKADLLIPSVSAASVVAKVARDRFMAEQEAEYPAYKFATHVGYGTALHRAAIELNGVTPLHRLSIAPLAKYRTVSAPIQAAASRSTAKLQTTRKIGDVSETVAAEELARRGHEIIARNWKTKYCEIDIVSKKGETYYFTEVKHRRDNKSGDGLSAITPSKLRQMRYAARFYAHTQKLKDVSLQLYAITTSQDEPRFDCLLSIDE
jgi:ribonuclease HII